MPDIIKVCPKCGNKIIKYIEPKQKEVKVGSKIRIRLLGELSSIMIQRCTKCDYKKEQILNDHGEVVCDVQ